LPMTAGDDRRVADGLQERREYPASGTLGVGGAGRRRPGDGLNARAPAGLTDQGFPGGTCLLQDRLRGAGLLGRGFPGLIGTVAEFRFRASRLPGLAGLGQVMLARAFASGGLPAGGR
jgi:hypothetical protein